MLGSTVVAVPSLARRHIPEEIFMADVRRGLYKRKALAGGLFMALIRLTNPPRSHRTFPHRNGSQNEELACDRLGEGRRTAQRPPYQGGGHNGSELGHGTFCGFLSAVRLGLRLPSIFRRRRSFILGFAGWA